MSQDLIAAVATPAGAGGVGVIRASGAGIGRLTAMLSAGALPPPRIATRQRFLAEDGGVMDDGIALYFPAPASFTGEDVLELHAHGGVFVLQQLLARAVQLGARLAVAGEFTLRAHLNGKLDLAQAEALADLINAGSAAAARAAARSLTGAFSTHIADFTRQLRQARVALESDLDFSDEDAHTPDAAATDIDALLSSLDSLLAATRQGARLSAGADVVIIGAPNVGKSSLLNCLAGEEAAIVSAAAGTTRDLIARQVVIKGLPLRLTDTAGLRDSGGAVEREGIARAQAAAAAADIVLRVCAGDMPPPPLPADSGAAVIEVRNKIDLTGEEAGGRDGVQYLSAKTGAGLDALQDALCAAAGHAPDASAFSARARHVAALEQARAHLHRARAAPPEVAAAWLRDADSQLQTIVGTYDEEDLLGAIFSTFCIGK